MSEQNISRTKRSSQAIDNFSFDEDFLVKVTELVRRNAGGTAIEYFNPATEEKQDIQADKIPMNDLYLTWNADGTVATKVWKTAGTSTVIKTLTYNYSGGNLITKILS